MFHNFTKLPGYGFPPWFFINFQVKSPKLLTKVNLHMNLIKLFSFLLIAGFLIACGNDAPERTSATDAPAANPPPTNDMAQQPAAPQTVNYVSPDGSVHHYICSDFCEGSGSETPGTCPVCSKSLAHNQAWHNQGDQQQSPQIQQQQSPGQTAPSSPLFRDGQQSQQVQPNQPMMTEPAQNAAGVWHYICSAGCSGGAGSPGSCAQCGAALSHNAAYHQ